MTNHSKIPQHPLDIGNDRIDIFPPVDKPQAFGKGQLANDIESVVLQPGAKVADAGVIVSISVAVRHLLQKRPRRGINQRLKQHERGHGVRIREGPAQLGMIRPIRGVEETFQRASIFEDALLDGVKVGFHEARVPGVDRPDGFRVSDGDSSRTEAHDGAVLRVQGDVDCLCAWSSAPDQPETPEIGVAGEEGTGEVVNSMAVFVVEEVDDEGEGGEEE